MNLSKLSKQFDIDAFLKKIKISNSTSMSAIGSVPPNVDIENLISNASNFEPDCYIQYGAYENETNEYSVQLYNTDILRDGSIFNKLNKSFSFNPIVTFIGYIDGIEPFQNLLGCLYSKKNKTTYITWFDDNANYFRFYFIYKKTGNLTNQPNLIKSFLKKFLKEASILHGLDNDIKFILLNNDLKINNNELPKLFIKAKKDRKKLLTYLKEDNLASNIITKEEINYDLNFYRLNKNKKFFFSYYNLFDKEENYVRTKLKKPSYILKID